MGRGCLQICIGHGKSFKTRHREQGIDKNSGLAATRDGYRIMAFSLRIAGFGPGDCYEWITKLGFELEFRDVRHTVGKRKKN